MEKSGYIVLAMWCENKLSAELIDAMKRFNTNNANANLDELCKGIQDYLMQQEIDVLSEQGQVSLRKHPIIKDQIQLLRHKIADSFDMDEKLLPNIFYHTLINFITYRNIDAKYVQSAISPRDFQGIDYFLEEKNFTPHWFIQASKKEIADLINHAIDDLCFSYILSYYSTYIFEKKYKRSGNQKVINTKKPANISFEDLSIDDANSLLNYISMDSLIASCYWAIIIEIYHQTAKPLMLDKIITAEHIEKRQNKEYQIEIDKLKKSQKEMEGETNRLKAINKQLIEKNERLLNNEEITKLKKQLEDLQREKELIERKLNNTSVENVQLKDRNRQLEKEKTLLEQRRNNTSAQSKHDEPYLQIDHTKKYLFVTTDDSMVKRLKAWFPNSIISSDGKDITSNNADTIHMIIYITPKVSHDEYYRIKSKNDTYNIPSVHCNKQSYNEICKAIYNYDK